MSPLGYLFCVLFVFVLWVIWVFFTEFWAWRYYCVFIQLSYTINLIDEPTCSCNILWRTYGGLCFEQFLSTDRSSPWLSLGEPLQYFTLTTFLINKPGITSLCLYPNYSSPFAYPPFWHNIENVSYSKDQTKEIEIIHLQWIMAFAYCAGSLPRRSG